MPVRDSKSSELPPNAKVGAWGERLLSLSDEMRESFSFSSMERGKQYFSHGRVRDVGYSEDSVVCVVQGTYDYETAWSWESDEWLPGCSCPVGPYCKHAYALACLVLTDGMPAEQLQQPWIASLLPSDPPSVRKPTRSVPITRTNREAAALNRFRTERDPWNRSYALADLIKGDPNSRLSVFSEPFDAIVDVPDPDMRCFLAANAIADRTDGVVPQVLATFLDRKDLQQQYRAQVEEALIERVGVWMARPLSRARRNLRLELQLSEKRTGNVLVNVEARLSSAKLHDELRTLFQLRQLFSEVQREPGLMSPEQQELLQILVDPVIPAIVFETTYVPGNSILPEHQKSFLLSGSGLLRIVHATGTFEEGAPLVTWSAGVPAHLASRVGVVPGEAVRLGSGSVSIEPSLTSRTGVPRVVLEYTMPDGSLLNESEMVIIRGRAAEGRRREPTLILARGAFWTTRGDVPAAIADLFTITGGFALSRQRSRAMLEPLARVYPRFRQSMAARTRVHDVRLIACLDLRDDDWLQIRAFAMGASRHDSAQAFSPPAPLYEWSPDGLWLACPWGNAPALQQALAGSLVTKTEAVEELSSIAGNQELHAMAANPVVATDDKENSQASPPTSDSEVLMEIPDPARTVLLGGWMESTGATSGLLRQPGGRAPNASDRNVGGWLKLGTQGIERFANAWENRPAGVVWFGNSAAQRLFAPATQMTPRLRIVSSGIDWFTVDAAWEAEHLALTDADLAKLRTAQTRFVKLKSGWVRKDQVAALDAAADALAELGIEAGTEERVSVWQLARARPEALAALEDLANDQEALKAVRELRKRIAAFKGLPRVAVPRSIRAQLRPYQREGLDFLAHTSSLGIGAILADDMGLGKTLQALAWLAWLGKKESPSTPSLVVCPASVIHNWEREAQRFAPSLRILTLTAGAQRHALRRQIPEYDLVVTNYALLRRDLEELQRMEWRAVILDEAQNIKNPDAVVSKAAKTLRARHRLALTGTPLENRVLDLWSIVTFLNPGYLGTRTSFEQRFDRIDVPPHARRLLAAKLRPIMLRRLKKQVAPELPPRIEERRDCDLTPGQRKLYIAEVAKGRALIQKLASSGGLQRNKISILALLTRLRQICCHPALAGGRESLGSGKFDALFELLDPLFAEGHKVLVFSQFVECLKLIDREMRLRGIAHHMLTGQSRNRAELVAAFERDLNPAAFLISLKAGGTGLNLTAASYVILFDPWWNPAVEAQAIDRTHRIGQDRTVIAYRMLARGTIEDRIWDLQQQKASLVSDVLGEDGFAKTLTREDLDYLLAET